MKSEGNFLANQVTQESNTSLQKRTFKKAAMTVERPSGTSPSESLINHIYIDISKSGKNIGMDSGEETKFNVHQEDTSIINTISVSQLDDSPLLKKPNHNLAVFEGISAYQENKYITTDNSPESCRQENSQRFTIKQLMNTNDIESSVAAPSGFDDSKTSIQQRSGVPINVITRVRPLIPNEYRHPVCIEVVDSQLGEDGQKTQIVVRRGDRHEQKMYSFEKVLDPESSQQKVFAEVDGQALTNAFLNGQNCTIFVYGPTSTGKTFTMQGNAEDIIHGKNQNQGDGAFSATASQCSGVSIGNDESLDLDIGRKHNNTAKAQQNRLGLSNIAMKKSQSLYQKRGSGESSSFQTHPQNKRIDISKAARDMIIESRDKGIIQRVVDHVYERFASRADLQKNCEIRISFLEIYKENVTDLLEFHRQLEEESFTQKLGGSHRNFNKSFAPQAPASDFQQQQQQKNPSNRAKAKTFYGEQDLEDILQMRSSKIDNLDNSPNRSNKGDANFSRRSEGVTKSISPHTQRKHYQVKENAIRGVYVHNLNEMHCQTAEQAYHCFLDGLMRKRMSQTARNTSSSRSHTIFQIKLYMRPGDESSSLLLPQYQQKKAEKDSETKLIAKFSLIDLAGSERITETEKNPERIDEARFINKSLSALGNVVAALRTQAKHNSNVNTAEQPASSTRRSSSHASHATKANSVRRLQQFDKQPASIHVPFRDSKLTHILKDCLGSNSFTHLIVCLSPSYLCIAESISTLAFTKNAKAVRQNIVENVQFKADMVQRENAKQMQRCQSAQVKKGGGPNSLKNSMLNQMAGNSNSGDDEAIMLREVLQELNGGGNISGLSIKQLFQITLEQLRKFKEDHNDMSNKIEELKSAMDKDLSNPRTLEIITQGHSDQQSDIHIPISIPSDSDLITKDYIPSSYFSVPVNNKFPETHINVNSPQGGASDMMMPSSMKHQRANSLKSISEEDHSASVVASPQSKPEHQASLSNVHHLRPRSDVNVIRKESSNRPHQNLKHGSTSSVVTFGGGELFHRQTGVNGVTSNSNITNGIQDRDSHNLQPFTRRVMSGYNSNDIDVHDGLRDHENSCETGGGRTPQNPNESSQLIETEPAENLEESTPCGCSHVKYLPVNIRTRMNPVENIQRIRQTQGITTMRTVIQKHILSFIRKRFRMELGRGVSEEHLHASAAQAKSTINNLHRRRISHEALIMQSRKFDDATTQEAEIEQQRQQFDSAKLLFGQFDRRSSHDNRLQKKLNMNGLRSSQSIPNELLQEKRPLQSPYEDQTNKTYKRRGSREHLISDIYSSDSNDYTDREVMLQKGYESSPLAQKYQYPRIQHHNWPLKLVDSIQRFEQSSQGNKNYFESSRYSGSNSQPDVGTQLAQSQSQGLLNNGRGVKVVQLRSKVLANSQKRMHEQGSRTKVLIGKKCDSKTSLNSNDIIVVEEVNDNDISSEAFRRIRKTDQQHTFTSMLTDGRSKESSSVNIGPLLDDNQLPKHMLSRKPQQQSAGVASRKPSSCLSSIQQDQSASQFGDSRLFFKSSKLRSQESLTISGSPAKYINPKQQRMIQKTLISDLNKVHNIKPTTSFGQGYSSETMRIQEITMPKMRSHQQKLYTQPPSLQTILSSSNRAARLDKAISYDERNLQHIPPTKMEQRTLGSRSFQPNQGYSSSPSKRFLQPQPKAMGSAVARPNKPTKSTKISQPLAGNPPGGDDF